MADSENEAKINTNAGRPKRVKGDEGEFEQMPIADQIAADKYVVSKRAARKSTLGIRSMKYAPPGTP